MDGRTRSILARGRLSCHCLLVEGDRGLTLVDTGFGLGDVADPNGRLSPFFLTLLRPEFRAEMKAVRQIERLGFAARRDGHRPHPPRLRSRRQPRRLSSRARSPARDRARLRAPAGALARSPALPAAAVVVALQLARLRPARGRALVRLRVRSRARRRSARGAAGAAAVHTLGHVGVAVQVGSRWLLQAGNAYFYHRQMDLARPWCTPRLRLYQTMMEQDRGARLHDQERLRD